MTHYLSSKAKCGVCISSRWTVHSSAQNERTDLTKLTTQHHFTPLHRAITNFTSPALGLSLLAQTGTMFIVFQRGPAGSMQRQSKFTFIPTEYNIKLSYT